MIQFMMQQGGCSGDRRVAGERFCCAPVRHALGAVRAFVPSIRSGVLAATLTGPLTALATEAAVHLPPELPLRRDSSSLADTTGMVLLTVLIVIAVAALAVLLYRRRFGALACRSANPVPAVRVHGSLRLNAKVSLHVLDWESRKFLVACSDSTVQVLGESPGPSSGKSQGARR